MQLTYSEISSLKFMADVLRMMTGGFETYFVRNYMLHFYSWERWTFIPTWIGRLHCTEHCLKPYRQEPPRCIL